MKTHYSCAELAAMKLPGLPESKKGLIDKAEREKWPRQKRAGRGGGYEYQPPQAVLKKIKELTINQLITGDSNAGNQVNQNNTVAKASPTAQSTNIQASQRSQQIATVAPATTLKSWQREIAEARAAICQEIRRLAEVGGTDRAIRTVVELAAANQLPPNLQQLVPVANARAGESRGLSRTSIYRWLNDLEKGVSALAPKSTEQNAIPAWASALISLMANPQKPTLKACMEVLPQHLPAGVQPPSYWAADRFLNKMGKVDVQRGRMGNRELKNIRPFVRRDTSQMWPGDAYTADGHTFDAEIAHRDHGRPFRPEITTVIDIATRKAVGWSVGLAESTWSVLDSLRHACIVNGIPAIFYVDNGSGFKNAAMSHEATGFMARLGITLTHSLPYNSQARGIIERAHQTLWVKGAKQLPTYMGADMDTEAKQKVFKITRSDIKKTGSSKLLLPWNIFVGWCQEQVDKYNDTPHRSLPTIRDPITNNKRHQSPNEAWATAIAEGWTPTAVEANEADDLFRPYKECKVTRGEISLFANRYFSHDLEEYHGEKVRVGYDLHDASRVWVRNKAGQLICIAEFEANKRSYFPESFIQQAAVKRAAGRIKRAEAKIEEAQAELDAPMLIEQQPVFEIPRTAINTPQSDRLPSTPDVQIVKNGVVGKVLEMPAAEKRPMFDTQANKYRWLLENPRAISAEDEAWLDYYRLTPEWEDLFGDREVATR